MTGFVVVDDTASSMADAKMALAAARDADPDRRHLYALRYDGGAYLVIRRELP